jgi:hypothetical protein
LEGPKKTKKQNSKKPLNIMISPLSPSGAAAQDNHHIQAPLIETIPIPQHHQHPQQQDAALQQDQDKNSSGASKGSKDSPECCGGQVAAGGGEGSSFAMNNLKRNLVPN